MPRAHPKSGASVAYAEPDRPDEPGSGLLDQAAVAANSFKVIAPALRSTGFRSEALRYRTLEDPFTLRTAEEFLVNSRLLRGRREASASIESYFTDSATVMLSMHGRDDGGAGSAISLPPSVPLRMGLDGAFAARRSRRLYTGDALALNYLATMLRSAAGVTGSARVAVEGGQEYLYRFRSAASAGGLYPVDLYFAALHVRSLPRGLYRYAARDDVLHPVRDEAAIEPLLDCFCVPETSISVRRSQVVFLLVGQPWRTMRKYGARGLRFVFLEAGAISQSIGLAASALGLGCVDCASIYEDEAHEAIGVDGLFRTLLHCIVLGYPA